jgi:asparagine synthase (glutamine-hydrolysing)
MCGIAGYAGFSSPDLLERMCSAMVHRGPDDEGFYRNKDAAFGNRRLAIIDIAGGHQPMMNETSRIVAVHNGEIYNFQELAHELITRGHTFKTQCDTEAIIHAYEEYGKDFVQRLNGMFAIAVYDEDRDLLLLARDRLGVKPLYYSVVGGKLIFASEIKALLEYEGLSRSPNLRAISDYLAYRFVPGPETLFEGVWKLAPGHILTYACGEIKVERYWQAPPTPPSFEQDKFYEERFAELLESSVRTRLVSDVPFGAFLSGGVDSSVIVGLMSRQLQRPVKTFSAGFSEARHDELGNARRIAQQFECDHTEVICRTTDLALLPKIIFHLDEPVGDAVIVPMYLLAQTACQSVKMVLTGQGADEILGGYVFHKALSWFDAFRHRVPGIIRRLVVLPILRSCPGNMLNLAFSYPASFGDKGKQKVLKFLNRLERLPTDEAGRELISFFDDEEREALWPNHPTRDIDFTTATPAVAAGHGTDPLLNQLLLLPHPCWLADLMLTTQDKLTMACSIEGREPYLDHRLVELLAVTPPHLKLRSLTDKYLLREYAERLLPAASRKQAKQPFYMPLENYVLCKEFLHLINETLTEDRVRRRGLFRWEIVRELLKNMQGGGFFLVKQVVILMCLELWFQIFIDRRCWVM